MYELLANKRLMVVVAHPDDELLGPGGTIYRLVHEFAAVVHIVILGEGITSRSEQRNPADWEHELSEHHHNIITARTLIGAQSGNSYNFPDNRFDTVPLLDLIKTVEKEKRNFNPDTIFTHHGGDLNVDHQRTFEAVITACRPMKEESVRTILTFETPSGTEWRAATDPRHFVPTVFFPISQAALEAKIAGMEAYVYERREYPHPRSPEALRILARRWGVAIGTDYAEAFSLVRLIG